MSDVNNGDAPTTATPRIDFNKSQSSNVTSFERSLSLVTDDNYLSKKDNEDVEKPVNTTHDEHNVSQIHVSDESKLIERDTNNVSVDPMASDLNELSVEELQKHQEEVDNKIREKLEAQKQEVIQQVIDVMNQFSITPEELIEALGGIKIKRKGVKAKPKYRDPITGAVWSGRGKEPSWIRGKDRDTFLIPE